MDTLATAGRSPSVPGMPWLRVFLAETRCEFLRLLRSPSFCVPTIAFPLMFYLLFGVLLGGGAGHPEAARRALASFVVIATMAPGLFALGTTLAVDRERGLLELKRALPLPAGALLAAKMAMAMLFAAIAALVIMLTAALCGGVSLAPAQWGLLLLLVCAGVLPFCAIGLYVGSCVRAAAAPAVLNLVYLPMSFLSGLWIPLAALPRGVASVAPLWPSWHLAQLGLEIVGVAFTGTHAGHFAALSGVTLVFFVAARRRLARPR